jgi:hypothetical protein
MVKGQGRHRWELSKTWANDFLPGPQRWHCVKCGLWKVTDYERKSDYAFTDDGRTWRRFADPCSPDPVPVISTRVTPPGQKSPKP